MRDIRFRAWNKAGKIMLNWDTIKYQLNNQHFELMQFTGLHDKNGKEIYSGDLLKYENSDKTFEVKWANEGFWEFDGFCLGNILRELKLEIAGNIFEK